MKELSLTEFQHYCTDNGLKLYVYDTKNQKKRTSSTISFSVRFNEIFTSLNPNMIFLKGGLNTMVLSGVKSIQIWDEDFIVAKVFTVICCSTTKNGKDAEYTFMAK